MSQPVQVLLVDDDEELSLLIAELFRSHNFTVTSVHDIRRARQIYGRQSFDLLIVDVMIPGGSGLDLCREIRAASNIPIILLTALSSLLDRVIGLELGADDYLTKPFEGRELLARARALLRRCAVDRATTASRPSVVSFGGWRLDLARQELRRDDGALVPLATVEFRLLAELAARPNITMSRDWLIEAVDSNTMSPESRAVDVVVSRLRAKMRRGGDAGSTIETVRPGGYVLRTS